MRLACLIVFVLILAACADSTSPASDTRQETGNAPAAESSKKDPKSVTPRVDKRAATDLRMITTAEGSGRVATAGDRISVHYTGWLQDDGYADGKGEEFDSSIDRGVPFELILGTGDVIKGWDQGLNGMRESGKRTLIIPPDLAYGQRGRPPVIPQNATLIFDIEVVGVTDLGMQTIVRAEGDGAQAAQGDVVSVHYSGWLQDDSAADGKGEMFDSSVERGQPIEFVLGTGRVIKGWDLGLTGMLEGGRRTLIIPSELAYGPRGKPPAIPPGATLIFDVELVATEKPE